MSLPPREELHWNCTGTAPRLSSPFKTLGKLKLPRNHTEMTQVALEQRRKTNAPALNWIESFWNNIQTASPRFGHGKPTSKQTNKQTNKQTALVLAEPMRNLPQNCSDNMRQYESMWKVQESASTPRIDKRITEGTSKHPTIPDNNKKKEGNETKKQRRKNKESPIIPAKKRKKKKERKREESWRILKNKRRKQKWAQISSATKISVTGCTRTVYTRAAPVQLCYCTGAVTEPHRRGESKQARSNHRPSESHRL